MVYSKIKKKIKFSLIKKGKKDLDLFELEELKKVSYLKKFHKECKILIELHHKLYFCKTDEKSDIEHDFALLTLIRTKDYFLGITSSILKSHNHSTHSILRSLIESLFLLKYMQKKPEKILKFMKSDKIRFSNISDIKKEVADTSLDEYYKYLCELDHSNRIALKQTYYKKENFHNAPSDTRSVISDIPLNYEEMNVNNLISALNMYKCCLDILKEIMNKEWKRKNK